MKFEITKKTIKVSSVSFTAAFSTWRDYYESAYYKNWNRGSDENLSPDESVEYEVEFDIKTLKDTQIIKNVSPSNPITISLGRSSFVIESSTWHSLAGDIVYSGYYLIPCENGDTERLDNSISQHYLLMIKAIEEVDPNETLLKAETKPRTPLEERLKTIEEDLFWLDTEPEPSSLVSSLKAERDLIKRQLEVLEKD